MHVSELAKESGEKRYPFESTGLKEAVERIQTDTGSFKGELYFKATFVPAMALQGIKFDTKQGEGKAGDETSSSSSLSSSDEDMPMEVTIKRRSTGSLHSPKAEGAPVALPSSDNDEPAKPRNAEEGIELSTEKLLAQRLSNLLCPIFAFTRFLYLQNLALSYSMLYPESLLKRHGLKSPLTMGTGLASAQSNQGADMQNGSTLGKVF